MPYIHPTGTNPQIVIADSHISQIIASKKHVPHLYDFIGDKLIIGKFCQIAKGVNFIMNGANHQMNSLTTYPFYIFDGWEQNQPDKTDLPLKGDTIVGNDVWIGENVTILPGIKIGDGAIIGSNSVVSRSIEPYSIVAGNPARLIRKRFDDELIAHLENFKWWDKPVDEINTLIPILTDNNLEKVKETLENLVKQV